MLDPKTASQRDGIVAQAGARDVELVLPREPGTQRVAGRLLSFAGDPIPGIRLVAVRPGSGEGQARAPSFIEKAGAVVTDGEGRFEFEALATAGTKLRLEGEPLFQRWITLADHDDPGDLELILPLLCEVQVDLGVRPGLADRLKVLDEQGEPLRLVEFLGAGFSLSTGAMIRGGLSSVFRVDERARTLVLYQKGEEVLRTAIELNPRERTVLEL